MSTSAQQAVRVGQEWRDRGDPEGRTVIVEALTNERVYYRWNDDTGIHGNRSLENFRSLFEPVGKGLKNGDKVTILSIPGLAPDHEDVGSVVTLSNRHVTSDGRILFSGGGWGLYEDDVELAGSPLDPSKVKAGDTVTVRVEADPKNGGTFDVTGKAYMDYGPFGGAGVTKVGSYSLDGYNVTLTDHQPAPEPGPTPGTFGTAVVDGNRQHGLIDEDGDFAYQVWEPASVDDRGVYGGDRFAKPSEFSDFKPYEDEA